MGDVSRDAVAADASLAAGGAMSHADRLAELQLTFNLYPAVYAHPSWLPQLGDATAEPEQADELRASPLWIRAMSSALLRSGRLDQHFDCDFFDPAKRLALLDATTLIRIAGLVSATLLRERLMQIVQQTHVRAVQACIGAEAHAFAVRWSGMLPMVNPAIEAGHWPEHAEWQRLSVAQLLTALPAHAIGVVGRLRLRFPRDWALITQQRVAEPARAGLTRLIIAVMQHGAPQWRWLFEAHATAEQC